MARLLGLRPKRGSSNFAYVTARVRAKKASLLPRDTYPKLLHRDVNEIARSLQEGAYKDEVDELGGRYRGAELIERATRLNMGRTFNDILGYSRGELQAMLALFLGRYDVYNVKTLLRGKFTGAPAERIEAELIPAGSLTEARLTSLARLDTLDEVVKGLGNTPFGPVLEEHLGGQRDVPSLFGVENALDTTYYELLLASIPNRGRPNQAFRSFVEVGIDTLNLKTMLRLKAADETDLAPYWIPGGHHLKLEKAARLIAARPDEVTAELGDLPFWEDVEAGVERFLKEGDLNVAITAIDLAHIHQADDFSHRFPLSILPVVDFLLTKEAEVLNLRIIATGKETGLSEETIEGLIVQ